MQLNAQTNIGFDPLGSKTRWLRRCLFVIYSTLLIYGLFSPAGATSINLLIASDKILHFLGFAGFAYSTRLAFVRATAWKVWSLIILRAPVSESLQHKIQPSREFSWLDICANLAGVACGALCWWITLQLYNRWKAGI